MKKVCVRCGVEKDRGEFYARQKKWVHSWCKSCFGAYRIENRERSRRYAREWYASNKDHQRAWRKTYEKDNADALKLARQKYYQENKPLIREYQERRAKTARVREKERLRSLARFLSDPEKVRHAKRTWKKNNPAKSCADVAMRRAAKLRATPKWANPFFIEEIYDLARRRTESTGIRWHVDHIVPLRSKSVCGLHVEHNLRVITEIENASKGNLFWPDMPQETRT